MWVVYWSKRVVYWNPIGETLIIKTTRIKDVRIFSIELSAILTIS